MVEWWDYAKADQWADWMDDWTAEQMVVLLVVSMVDWLVGRMDELKVE